LLTWQTNTLASRIDTLGSPTSACGMLLLDMRFPIQGDGKLQNSESCPYVEARVTIQLSDEQRQALASGQPVEVVDSDTQLALILLAAERYRQQVQEFAAGASSQPELPREETRRPLPPVPCHLRDLATPPEIAEYVKKQCAGLWFGRKKEQHRLEEELKLQYYFGGIYVGYLRTPEGGVVVAAGRSDGEVFWKQLEALPQEVRYRVVRFPPPIWNSEVSEWWTVFPYED